jgi:hypothetical protein
MLKVCAFLTRSKKFSAPGRQCCAMSIPISAPSLLWKMQVCVPLARLALRLWLTA